MNATATSRCNHAAMAGDLFSLSDLETLTWFGPEPETRPREDFVPRAGLELILHAHDVCAGLCVPFEPPPDLCKRLREHTREWPMWLLWSELAHTDDPWGDLLHASGRRRR